MIRVLRKLEESLGFGRPEIVSSRMATLYSVLIAIGAGLDIVVGETAFRITLALTSALLMALVPLFNAAGYFRWSRYYHIIVSNAVILVFCLLSGPDSSYENLFIGMGVLPLLLARPNKKDRFFVNFGVLLAAVCFVTEQANVFPQNLIPVHTDSTLVNVYVLLLGFLSPLSAVAYFRSDSEESNRRLRAATTELVTSHEELEVAIAAARLAPWQVDLETQEARLSTQFIEMFGLPEAMRNAKVSEFGEIFHPEDREMIFSTFAESVRHSNDFDLRYRLWIDHSKEPVWVASRGHAKVDPSTGKLRLIGISGDITALKKAELEVQKSRDEFKLMADMITPLIWVCAADGACEFVSNRLVSYAGIEAEVFHGSGWQMIIHPDDYETHTSTVAQGFKTGNDVDVESRFRRHDGVYLWHRSTARCMRDDTGKIVRWYGTSIDIDARKMLDAQLEAERARMVAASKMTALGEVASGIAHEINNPLAVIKGRAEQLIELASSGEMVDAKEVGRLSALINTTSTRIAKIIRSLKYFARNADGDEMQLTSVKSILDEAFELCREKFRADGVELIVDAGENDVKVQCRGVQLYQVIVNLLSNAYDAVQEQSVKKVRVSIEEGDGIVEVRVSDSGPGVPQAIVEKLFEPFFTTKKPGKGTGLGLSISKSLMQSNGGTLELEPSTCGATFVIRLASCAEEVAVSQQRVV